jgi:hypothetical protein
MFDAEFELKQSDDSDSDSERALQKKPSKRKRKPKILSIKHDRKILELEDAETAEKGEKDSNVIIN